MKLDDTPDFILQIFGLSCPVWNKLDIPYGYYLDYTMALAGRDWKPWIPYVKREFDLWIECERQAYQKATHLFPWSNAVKKSLIEDYGVDPEKITVTGSSGDFQSPYDGEKTIGTKQIFFNGSDFDRKGGDYLLAAFRIVKKQIPEAQLIIVGKNLDTQEEGIYNPGFISSPLKMRELFLSTDIVVAPARCEPYGGFLVEAMNYGVPCIVSTSGGMPEIVDHGANGIVIPDMDHETLAKEIISLLSDRELLTKMSGNSREKVKNDLNWNSVARTILEVIA